MKQKNKGSAGVAIALFACPLSGGVFEVETKDREGVLGERIETAVEGKIS